MKQFKTILPLYLRCRKSIWRPGDVFGSDMRGASYVRVRVGKRAGQVMILGATAV